MPTPYNFDDLSSHLYEDFTWRLREIHALRKSLEAARDVYQDAIARASLAILYAHWEGYVKVCAECYLGYVAVRRLKVKNLNSHFLYLDNYQRIKRLAGGSGTVTEKI